MDTDGTASDTDGDTIVQHARRHLCEELVKPGLVFPPVTVETPHDALMWVDRGLSRAARATGPRVLQDILTNSGEIIISGAFEGVKTACIAAAFITKGCERWLDQPTGHAPTFKSVWSLEWNRSCLHAISAWDKHMKDDSCCFGDILDVILRNTGSWSGSMAAKNSQQQNWHRGCARVM